MLWVDGNIGVAVGLAVSKLAAFTINPRLSQSNRILADSLAGASVSLHRAAYPLATVVLSAIVDELLPTA